MEHPRMPMKPTWTPHGAARKGSMEFDTAPWSSTEAHGAPFPPLNSMEVNGAPWSSANYCVEHTVMGWATPHVPQDYDHERYSIHYIHD